MTESQPASLQSVTPSAQPWPLGPKSNKAKPPKETAAKWPLAAAGLPSGPLLTTSEEKLMSHYIIQLLNSWQVQTIDNLICK